MTIWLAPILVFTCEEAWAARDPDAALGASRAVPDLPGGWRDDALGQVGDDPPRAFGRHRRDRDRAREAKAIGSSLEAHPSVYIDDPS